MVGGQGYCSELHSAQDKLPHPHIESPSQNIMSADIEKFQLSPCSVAMLIGTVGSSWYLLTNIMGSISIHGMESNNPCWEKRKKQESPHISIKKISKSYSKVCSKSSSRWHNDCFTIVFLYDFKDVVQSFKKQLEIVLMPSDDSTLPCYFNFCQKL
jgi:hypothetical protein